MYQESCYEYLFSDFVRHICRGFTIAAQLKGDGVSV